MHILVTGGAGFIGSHLVDKLLKEGKKVVVLDNFDPFYDPAIKRKNLLQAYDYNEFKFYEIDILKRESLEDIFSKYNFDSVVHIAAKAGVRPSIIDPSGYFSTNVQGTLNLLECCKKFKVNKFIFASTSSIYGNNKKVPFSEQDLVDYPVSPYAATKKSAELMCHTYYHLYGIKTYALRLFTVYGPRQRPDLAIHKFFKLIYHSQPIPFFGDGTTTRDYTFIDDIIDGITKSIEKVNGFEIINLGESRTIALNDLVALIEKISGKKAQKNNLPKQPGDVERTYADISKAKKILNYNPNFQIEEGLEIFHQWFIKNLL